MKDPSIEILSPLADDGLLVLIELGDAVVLGFDVPDALVLVVDGDVDVDAAVVFKGDMICIPQISLPLFPFRSPFSETQQIPSSRSH
jgi:hypothetical protein